MIKHGVKRLIIGAVYENTFFIYKNSPTKDNILVVKKIESEMLYATFLPILINLQNNDNCQYRIKMSSLVIIRRAF